jgi:hypothetical protein
MEDTGCCNVVISGIIDEVTTFRKNVILAHASGTFMAVSQTLP